MCIRTRGLLTSIAVNAVLFPSLLVGLTLPVDETRAETAAVTLRALGYGAPAATRPERAKRAPVAAPAVAPRPLPRVNEPHLWAYHPR
jgi:hypothetical protein